MSNPFLFPFPYIYRVILTSIDCLAKRAVSFQKDRILTWDQINDESLEHIYSQTCSRCGRNHDEKTYVATDIDFGVPDEYGSYAWGNVKADPEKYAPKEEEAFYA